jgi:hypothetical protein
MTTTAKGNMYVQAFDDANRTITFDIDEPRLERMRRDPIHWGFLTMPPTPHWDHLKKFLVPMLVPIDPQFPGHIGVAKLSCRRHRDGRYFRTTHYFPIIKVVRKKPDEDTFDGWMVHLVGEVKA